MRKRVPLLLKNFGGAVRFLLFISAWVVLVNHTPLWTDDWNKKHISRFGSKHRRFSWCSLEKSGLLLNLHDEQTSGKILDKILFRIFPQQRIVERFRKGASPLYLKGASLPRKLESPLQPGPGRNGSTQLTTQWKNVAFFWKEKKGSKTTKQIFLIPPRNASFVFNVEGWGRWVTTH